jgi:hypothetical protein
MRKKEFGLNQKDNSPDQLERFLKVVFFFVFTIPFFAFIAWYFGLFRESEVLVSKPIGRFMSMSGPGGLGNRVVIQTDLGSYPLLEAPVIAKGLFAMYRENCASKPQPMNSRDVVEGLIACLVAFG